MKRKLPFVLSVSVLLLRKTRYDYKEDKYYTEGAYCNIEGECVIDFEQFNDKHEFSCGDFNDGYAWMSIVGTDDWIILLLLTKTVL